ncbi:MAG: carboxypeptidase-like regulatory domain-containing protein [Candidatus Woesearchaeota archaeon]
MKKRFLLYALFFSIALTIIFSVPFVSSEDVCGHTPDSLQGYGQINIMGVVYSCNNNPDGFCPEEYQDFNNSAIFGNCSKCPDPDCRSRITGTVYNYLGQSIDRANVTTHPIRYNLSAPSLENGTVSGVLGQYTLDAVTGTYYVGASYPGYDTELKEVSVVRNSETLLDFHLQNGTCYEDCTNSYGRCNAACSGIVFADDSCMFYNDVVMNVCNNRLKGTQVMIPDSFNGTHATFVDCCEGTPYIRYYQTANVTADSSIKNLAKFEKLVKYNEQPVRIIVAYWQN